MRFNIFLNEKSYTLENIASILQTECSQYINDIKNSNQRLYRGLEGESKSFIMHNSKKRRQPIDTNKEFQKILDKEFQSVFGAKLRANSFFCSGNSYYANRYRKRIYSISFKFI